MGKEWLFRASAGGGDRGGGARRPSTGKPRDRRNFSGCMGAIFNIFEIQNQHLRFQPSPNFVLLHGVEAPRNSLELKDATMEVASSSSSSSKTKEEINLNYISMDGIQIKTKRSRLTDDLSSECSSSPGIKTPSLVARLMGLDLLPENSSPRPSASSATVNPNPHSCSTPTTPRSSTTDVDYHHRLSLQTDKENRAGHQIAKRMIRERLGRRVGADITNTAAAAAAARGKEQRRDQHLVLLKPKRPPPPSAAERPSKNSLDRPVSSSPLSSSPDATVDDASVSSSSECRMRPPHGGVKVQKGKRCDSRVRKMQQQEEVFVKKVKKKSTPLSNQPLKVNATAKFPPSKKHITSPTTAARLPQKQVSSLSTMQSPSNPNRPYNANDSHDNYSTASAAGHGGGSFSDHHDYISKILHHAGITKHTPISVTHWHSPSHPLNPSIFHHSSATTSAAAERLVFDLVDELLVGILKPFIGFKPWVCSIKPNPYRMSGSELVGRLCERIGSFPAADCRVLEDVDRLVDGDMGRSMRAVAAAAFEEEAEEIVAEMERGMVEMLMHEMLKGGENIA